MGRAPRISQRVTCPICGRRVALLLNGAMLRHGRSTYGLLGCPGSGRTEEEARGWLKGKDR